MLQGGFEVFGDIGGDDFGGREVGGVFEGFVLEPEDVEVDLIALEKILVAEALEALGLRPLEAVLGIEAGNEVVEVGPLERILLQSEVLVGPQVVDPELLGPGLLVGGWLAVEEEDIRLHSLRVEDPGRQPQQRVDVGLLEQSTADRLSRPSLEEHVIRQHHSGTAMLLEDREDVLEEVELLVARARPEIISVDRQALLGLLARLVNDRDTALLAEGRIRQHQIILAVLPSKAILGDNREIAGIGLAADPVEEEIHRAETRHTIDQLDPVEGAVLELLLLLTIKGEVISDVVVRGEQKAPRATGRIADRLSRLGCHHIDHGGDEGTRGKVLSGTTLYVSGILLEEPLVGVTLDIDFEARPLLLVDQVDNQAAELGRVLDFVLSFAEDDAEHPWTLAEFFQRVPVVGLQIIPVEPDQGFPVESGWDRRGLVEGRLRLLIRHLEKEEEGQLLDIVPIGEAVIPEDVAVVPELLDKGGSGHLRRLKRISGDNLFN